MFDVGFRVQRVFILQHSLWDKKKDKKWNILNVYVVTHDENKDTFLTELASFCSRCKDPYLKCGDFDIMRFFSEKNKRSNPNRFSDVFNNIIQVNGLRDMTIGGGKYTWSNNQVNPTLEKLDRVLMTREWELLFPTVTGWLLPRELSDHNPIAISTQKCAQVNRREFRFELS
jgi:hypothetical protein